jgi:hypothetical protein
MKKAPPTTTAPPDPFLKVRQKYERQYDVRFSDDQWLEILNEVGARSASSAGANASVSILHEVADWSARFLSLGTPRQRRRRKRETVKGRRRGAYARPALEGIDLVLHVTLCKSLAKQLRVQWRWSAFKEAHKKRTGLEEDEETLKDRYLTMKRRLRAVVPPGQEWLLWPQHRAELLTMLGVRNLKALAEEEERPIEWVQEVEEKQAARRAKLDSVPPPERDRIRRILERQDAQGIAFAKSQGLRPYPIPTAWEPKVKAMLEADRAHLRSLPPVDSKQKKADRNARIAKAAAARKRWNQELHEEDLACLVSISIAAGLSLPDWLADWAREKGMLSGATHDED